MANLIGSYLLWTPFQGSLPNFDSGATPAGSDRGYTFVLHYNRNEADDSSNMQATRGGISSTSRTFTKAGNNSIIIFHWDETAVSQPGTQVVVTGSSTPVGYYCGWYVEDAPAGNPFTQLTDGSKSPGETGGQTVTLQGVNDLQVVVWGHWGTSKRAMNPDPLWNEVQDAQWDGSPSIAADFGISDDAAGGNVSYTLTEFTADSYTTSLIGLEYATATPPGLQFNSVDGDNTLDPSQVLDTDDNRAKAFADNSTSVTSVTLAGITQTDFEHFPATADEAEHIRFSVVMDAATDLSYGTHDVSLLGDPGGTQTLSCTLTPPPGFSEVTVGSYTYPLTNSVFNLFADATWCAQYGFDPVALINLDNVEYSSVTSENNTVTIPETGIPTVAGGQTTSQSFKIKAKRQNDSGQWTTNYGVVFVNYPALFTSVNGVTGSSGKVDLAAINLPFVGDNLGVSLGDGKLYAMPGENADLDTDVAVLQNPLGTEITAFTNEGFTLAAVLDGGIILSGTYVTWWFLPGE